MTSTRRVAAIAVGGTLVVWLLAHLVLPHGAPFGVVLQGAVFGSLYALGAVGLVLVYKASRVVNFAQAELGSIAGVVAVHLGAQRGWNYFVAVFIGLLIAAAAGAAVERFVIRRFRDAPRLILAVVTIGVAQILNGASIVLAIRLSGGARSGSFETPFSTRFGVSPITFDGDYVVAMAAVPVVLAALAWFLMRSDHGVAVRAVADSTDRALLAGIPVARLSSLVWTLAGMLSGIAVILRVPITGFISFTSISQSGTSLLVRTLAAAVIARMESLTIAAGAAIGLGVFEAVATWNTGNATIVDALLVGVILVALLAQRPRARREDETALHTSRFRAVREVKRIPTELRRLPEVRMLRLVVHGALLVFAVTLPLWLSPSREQLAAVVLIYGIVAVGLVVLTGWAGQISLGHWALVGIGGAATAALHARQGWDLFLAMPAGILITGLVALTIGLPALRVRGPFLAVTTLAFALTASTFFLQPKHMPWFVTERFERPVLWGRITLDSDSRLYLVALGGFLLVLASISFLRRTRTGRAFVALRDNEPAAQAVAIPTTRLKLVAFVLSGAIAGFAGSLYVLFQNGVRPDAFTPEVSLRIFSMAVIGGLGSLGGAVLGAVYVRGAEFFLPAGWSLVASGAGILLLLFFAPGGLGEIVYRIRDRFLRKVAARRGLVVPSLVADPRVVEEDSAPTEKVRAVARGSDGLLEVRGLDVSYERVQVLFGVDVSVQEGEVVALLGTNGAGKSTLLRAVSGLTRPDEGTITFDGADITGADPARIASLGIAQMPGGRSVFPTLSVRENLRMAGWLHRKDTQSLEATIAEVCDVFPILRDRWTTPAGALSGGEQQMLGLAQTLVARPKLLLIDELSLGLAPAVVDRLFAVVADANREGTTVVLVEQSANNALRLASRAVFMEKGEVRFDGSTKRLLERRDLLRAVFLGGTGTTRNSKTPRRTDVRLRASGLTKRYGGINAVDDVAIELRDEEILGIIGPNGAGKTTLFDLISGLVEADGGRVELDDVDVSSMPAHERARIGIGRSFQHARLWPSLTVREAIATARERHLAEPHTLHALFGLPQTRESEERVALEAEELIELLQLEAFRDKFVGELSTGSRRIVEIATILAHEPEVVLLDEPSSGIAQRETEQLGPLLNDVRERTGCAMLVIEHDMRLIAKLADRIVAMDHGQVIADGMPSSVLKDPQVVRSYLGTSQARPRTRKKPARRRAHAGTRS